MGRRFRERLQSLQSKGFVRGFCEAFLPAREWLTHRHRVWFKLFRHPGALNPKIWWLYLRHKDQGIPLKQVGIFCALIKLRSVLEQLGVPYFLFGGALLGAVRDGKFAGRPDDIDIAISSSDRQFIESTPGIFLEHGFKLTWLQTRPIKKKLRIRDSTGGDIDVHFFASAPSESVRAAFKLEEHLRVENHSAHSIVMLFGESFPGPGAPEQFLERYYGADWRVPAAPGNKQIL